MDNQNESQQLTSFQPGLFSKFKFFLAKNKFLIIVIAILASISFGTSGYLLIANKKTLPANTPFRDNITSNYSTLPSPTAIISLAPSPTSTPSPSLAPIDETATWSAYISTKYAYSLKYPPQWTAQITTQPDPKILEYVVFNPVATKAGTLSITLSYGTRTYLEALALDAQIGEDIIIASASATKKISKDSNGYKATNVIISAGLRTMIFNAKDAYANLFNKMLATLKLPK